MDYVLYTYGLVALGFIYGAIWTIGGQRARLVLTLGAYAFHPGYEPPSRAWRRAQVHRRGHLPTADGAPSWHQYVDRPAPGTTPHLVRAEQGADQYGAEHWGGLLAEMNTEERAIYNAAMVETYEATKAVERPALTALDRAVADFTAALAKQEQREAAVFEGTWRNLFESHGGPERWKTGAYVLVSRAS